MTDSPDYTLVYAKHPEVDGYGQMPRAALEGTDWTEVSHDEVEASFTTSAAAPDDLKGQALDDALDAAGLSKQGTAAEKRQRLADHQAGTPA